MQTTGDPVAEPAAEKQQREKSRGERLKQDAAAPGVDVCGKETKRGAHADTPLPDVSGAAKEPLRRPVGINVSGNGVIFAQKRNFIEKNFRRSFFLPKSGLHNDANDIILFG